MGLQLRCCHHTEVHAGLLHPPCSAVFICGSKGDPTDRAAYWQTSPQIYVSAEWRGCQGNTLCKHLSVRTALNLWGHEALPHFHLLLIEGHRVVPAQQSHTRLRCIVNLGRQQEASSQPGRHQAGGKQYWLLNTQGPGAFFVESKKNGCLLAGKLGAEKVINSIVCHK